MIANVQKALTPEVMRELNSRVQIDKQEPEKVAADFLLAAGAVGEFGPILLITLVFSTKGAVSNTP